MSLLTLRTTAVRRTKRSGEKRDATPRQDNPAGDRALSVYAVLTPEELQTSRS